jgi:serine/threonine protein kinase
MPEDWRQWVGSVVDTDIPLLDYIGGASGAAVFATTFEGKKAAVKLSTVDPATLDAQLANFRAIEKLSHPHLLKVYKSGRCQLGGEDLLFVVMEFADENLAQVLPQRPLNTAETREVLVSTLDALSYIHGQGFVHAGLKPGNIMASGEVLKLASDNVRRAGEKRASATTRPYDAPEIAQGVSPATDIWALGVTLVEIMTQRVPAGFKRELEVLPSPFREIAPRCLTNDPAQRATAAEISERVSPKRSVQAAPVVAAASTETSRSGTKQKSSNTAYAVVAAIAIIIAAAVAVPKLTKHPGDNSEKATESVAAPEKASEPKKQARESSRTAKSSVASQPVNAKSAKEESAGDEAQDSVKHYSDSKTTLAAKTEPVRTKAPEPVTSQGSTAGVLRQVMPSVSQNALNTIHGTVRVRLKLRVNPAGDVTGTEFVTRGPSGYFANHAQEAAQQWKFAPAESSRAWNLQFDFRRSGTTVSPSEVNR